VTSGKPVLRLVDVGSLEVSLQAPIDATRYVREAMSLTAEIEGKRVVTTVRAIVPVGDIVSRTIEIRLTLPTGSGLVGDAAKVLVPSALPRDVLAVPRDALVLREDNTYVFKVDGRGVVQRVAVETGAEQGALVEIRGSSIKPGESVIVRGAERLASGQKVRAVRVS
jgi:multidrug efflux pump subunit AcrA (membrane-fusion protein)